jgi:uncharacterized protein YjbI with pentapeptide repeats
LIERISILADGFSEGQRYLILSKGFVGDATEIRPINNEFDSVRLVVTYVRAISSLKKLPPEDPLCFDAKDATVGGQTLPLYNRVHEVTNLPLDPERTKHLLSIIEAGAEMWNKWREDNPNETPDLRRISLLGRSLSLRGANLRKADLREAILVGAQLQEADLTAAILRGADLQGAHLQKACLAGASLTQTHLGFADFSGADLRLADLGQSMSEYANFDNADLRKARLCGADVSSGSFVSADMGEVDLTDAILRDANLTQARLVCASLEGANLVEVNLSGADLTGCRVYGASIWKVNLTDTDQSDLVVTPTGESSITVDNLEVAQFTYLLLDNSRIRSVIDTLSTKTVLLLGRFTPDRKAVLDALREELRRRGFVPMLFDFEKPTQRDFSETIRTLAGICRFVIADLTNPKSCPLELQATVPDYMIPFVPIIQENEHPFSMFQDLKQKYDWVLDTLVYDTRENLIAAFDTAILAPALQKHRELLIRKAECIQSRHVTQYLDA